MTGSDRDHLNPGMLQNIHKVQDIKWSTEVEKGGRGQKMFTRVDKFELRLKGEEGLSWKKEGRVGKVL